MGAGQKPLELSARTNFPWKTCHCSKKHKRKLKASKTKGQKWLSIENALACAKCLRWGAGISAECQNPDGLSQSPTLCHDQQLSCCSKIPQGPPRDENSWGTHSQWGVRMGGRFPLFPEMKRRGLHCLGFLKDCVCMWFAPFIITTINTPFQKWWSRWGQRAKHGRRWSKTSGRPAQTAGQGWHMASPCQQGDVP